MKLTIKNTIEDYRCVQEYMYRYLIEKNKVLFNIFKMLLYASPWIAVLLQWKIIVNKEYFYITAFIIVSIAFDLLFYLVLKNNYPIKWLVNLSIMGIKKNKFYFEDKILESYEEYIKIYNDYGNVKVDKNDRLEVIRFNKGLILTIKKEKYRKGFIFIPSRSFANNNEINELISFIEQRNR
jgi:hypothetical protein